MSYFEEGRLLPLSDEQILKRADSLLKKDLGGSSNALILENLNWALGASSQEIARRALTIAKEGSETEKKFVDVYSAAMDAKIAARNGDTDNLIILAQTVQRLKEGKTESLKPQIPPQAFVGGGNLQRPRTASDILGTNREDPTKPYFRDADQGGTWVDPLAPHTDFSHDIPQTINPLNRPKPPTHGG